MKHGSVLEVEVKPLLQAVKNDLGTFEVVSGALRISDPSYDLSMGFAGTVKATNGTWRAASYTRTLKDWGQRVCGLAAQLDSSRRNLPWKECKFEVGVDTAIAGIFDLAHFRDNSVVTSETPISLFWTKLLQQERNWEGMCHTAAKGEFHKMRTDDGKFTGIVDDVFFTGSVVPFGVVSGSGYGDGGYPAYVKRNSKSEAVAVKIVFIDEDDIDDEDKK
jgi:hypothetical protein